MQHGEDMPDLKEDGELFLVLNISAINSGGSGTRASTVEFQQPQLNTEKMNSLRVIIVDVQRGSETENKVIFNDHSFLNYTLGISGWRYKISFETKYNVYLIANEESLSTNIQTQLKSLITGSDYTENTLENLVISNSVNIEAGSAFINNEPTYLNGQSAKSIPMAEMFVVDPVSRPTNSSAEEIKVEVKREMFVTRTASKFSFRIFKSEDYIQEPDKLTIKSIKITGLRKEEYLIPKATYDPAEGEASSNDYDGREITSFEIPLTSGNTIGDYVFTLPGDGLSVASLEEEAYAYSPEIYFPDSPVADDNKLTCTISYGEGYEIPVELDNLPYGLPRNTHAIVNITVGNNGKIFVTVDILPWTERNLTLDYTEIVNVSQEGKLRWTEDTYQNQYLVQPDTDDTETGVTGINSDKECVVVMKEWRSMEFGNSECVPLEGTFTIESPIGATWSAHLLQTAGQGGDAFAFQDINADGDFLFEEDDTGNLHSGIDDAVETEGGLSDGELSGGGQSLPLIKTPKLVSAVSGTVSENKSAHIKIFTRQDKPIGNVANRAVLQILVTVNNGGMVSVFEAPVNPDGISKYIIVQNP